MASVSTDVLVVGGGPAGATAAFQLAAAGIEVTLVDRATFPRDKVCGESLSPGVLARLSDIGMWQPSLHRGAEAGGPASSPMPIRGMRIRSPSGSTFMGRYRAGSNGTGLAMRRRDFDAELLASAQAKGVRVLQGVEIVGGQQTPSGGAVVEGRGSSGEAARFQARRVVVADGRQSLLARQLRFIEADRGTPGSRRYAVRAHCDGVVGLSDFAEMHVGKGGYCGIAPLSHGSANICYVAFSDRLDLAPGTIEADFRRHLVGYPAISDRLSGAEVRGPVRAVGPLRLISRRQSHGPFIACGDTTGFLDPFTGEGIAHAIASGILGAGAIRLALAGSRTSFSDYERNVRSTRFIKGGAARLLYGLVSRPTLANSAATLFARAPRLGDAIVRLFGDQV